MLCAVTRAKRALVNTMIKTYRELRRRETLEERFQYLSLGGRVGYSIFGFERWMNQKFYTSKQWRDIRNVIIARDNGCDLGIEGHEIHDRVLIHHMNPITPEDLRKGLGHVLDPEFLICVRHSTHNAIHYGDAKLLPRQVIQRTAGDTKLW